jgi:hypothetical protein
LREAKSLAPVPLSEPLLEPPPAQSQSERDGCEVFLAELQEPFDEPPPLPIGQPPLRRISDRERSVKR